MNLNLTFFKTFVRDIFVRSTNKMKTFDCGYFFLKKKTIYIYRYIYELEGRATWRLERRRRLEKKKKMSMRGIWILEKMVLLHSS